MMTSFKASSGLVAIACVALQACALAPVPHRPASQARDQGMAGVSAPLPGAALSDVASSLSAPLPPWILFDSLQSGIRGREEEAGLLRREAADLERQARTAVGAPGVVYAFPPSIRSLAERDALLAHAASLQRRADQLAREAALMREQLRSRLIGAMTGAVSGALIGAATGSSTSPRDDDMESDREYISLATADVAPARNAVEMASTASDGSAAQPTAPGASNHPGAAPPSGVTPARPAATDGSAPVGQADGMSAPPASNLAAESRKIDGLVKGSVAVSAPSTAKAGDTFVVSLRISTGQLSALMHDLQHQFPDNSTVKGEAGVRLTPRMVARVSGFGFEVAPNQDVVQAISASEDTTWEWQVKALESGLHTLTFTLAGALTIEGKEVTRNFYHYRQKVQVAVSPAGFWERNWQWLAATLLLPVLERAWAWLRTRKTAGSGRAGTRGRLPLRPNRQA